MEDSQEKVAWGGGDNDSRLLYTAFKRARRLLSGGTFYRPVDTTDCRQMRLLYYIIELQSLLKASESGRSQGHKSRLH